MHLSKTFTLTEARLLDLSQSFNVCAISWDTVWVIDHLHGREQVVRRLKFLAPQGIGLSIVSLAELYEGVLYSTTPRENEEALHNFLDSVEILYLE